MFSRKSLSFLLATLLLTHSFSGLQASPPYVWNGLGSNSDLNTASNWLIGGNAAMTPPGAGDDVVFDSTVTNINLSPTATTSFQIDSFQFPHSADFSFTFSGNDGGSYSTGSLVFNGANSISGSNTNPQITCNNINNDTTNPNNQPFAQIFFNNSTSNTTGSSTINLTNSGTNTGSTSADSSVIIGSQLYGPYATTIDSESTINVVNSGTNNASGGVNNVGFIQPLTTSSPASYGGGQLYLSNESGSDLPPMVIGDNVTITITNTGIDSSTAGSNNTGYVSQNQLIVEGSTITIGDNVTIVISNTGSSTATGGTNDVGYVDSEQLYLSTFGGLDPIVTAGDNLNITISNNGTFTPDSTATISNDVSVGYLGDQMVEISSSFQAGNNFRLIGTNTGLDSSHGVGGNYVGVTESYGFEFDDVTVLANATISHSNSGTFTGETTTSGNYLGYIDEYQIYFDGALTATDYFTMNATNTGEHSGSGIGGNNVGYIDESQVYFDGSVSLGNNATITIGNKGTFTGSNTANGNYVGYLDEYQLYAGDSFTAGDSAKLVVTNTGTHSGTGYGSNNVGTGNYQLYLSGVINLGNQATIIASNNGTYTGSNTTNANAVGYFSHYQMYSDDAFTAGDSFVMTATNVGVDSGSGHGANNIGFIGGYQMYFEYTCDVGNNAVFTASNSGTSSSTVTVPNHVGIIGDSQIYFDGAFSAGENLLISVTNEGNNTGNSSDVGYVEESPLVFADTCTFGNGTLISSANNGQGIVAGPQILFQDGFSLTNGTATIQATNSSEGTVYGGIGISVAAGSGGDVNIILNNNQLNVSSSASSFTIGQLNGDSTSSVMSLPPLTINTDAGVNATFDGTIIDYSGPSSLVKAGAGTQLLSGTNTYTGPTSIQGGTLVLTGSLAGSVNISGSGMLKGTGSIFGNVINTGTISPGQSIGTINFLAGFTNDGGNYNVEVNGAGESDLINVTGEATINGGTVNVSSSDGTYYFYHPYTILTASSVTGSYSGVTSANSLIIPEITQDLENIYLTLSTNIIAGANTSNQVAVATQLDTITDPTADQSLVFNQLVNLTTPQLQFALDNLSGFQHTFDEITSVVVNRQFIRRLYDPLRPIVTTLPNGCCSDPCDNFLGWFEAGGGHLNIDKNVYTTKFNADGYDLTGGIQTTIENEWTVGLAASYDSEQIHFSSHTGNGNNSTWLIGLYSLYRPSVFYGIVDFAYSQSNNKLTRYIIIGDLFYKAKSKPKTSQFTFYGEVGVDLTYLDVLVQPFFGLEAGSYHRDHLTETQSQGFGLNVFSRNYNPAYTRLGTHLTANFCDEWSLSADLAWDRCLSGNKNFIKEDFETFGSDFYIKGVKLNVNSIDYALTLSKSWDNWNVYLEGSGESWSNVNQYNVLGGLTYNW